MLKRNSTETKLLKHTDLKLLNYNLCIQLQKKGKKYETKYLLTS